MLWLAVSSLPAEFVSAATPISLPAASVETSPSVPPAEYAPTVSDLAMSVPTVSVSAEYAPAVSAFAMSVPAESVAGTMSLPVAPLERPSIPHLGAEPHHEGPAFPTRPFYPASGPAFHFSNGGISFDSPLIETPCQAKLSDGRPCPLVTRFHAPFCMTHSTSLLGLTVKVSSIPDAGRGLFATRDFPYLGEILTKTQLDVRYGGTAPYTLKVSSNIFMDSACLRGLAHMPMAPVAPLGPTPVSPFTPPQVY